MSNRCDDLAGALAAAFPADFRVSFASDRNDFDVRLGFAYDPSEEGNTIIRGGFGTYSGQFPGLVMSQSRSAFSDFLSLNYANFSPRSGDQTLLLNLANPRVRQFAPGSLGVVAPGTLNTLAPGVNPVSLLVTQLFRLPQLSLSDSVLGLDLVLPQRRLSTPYSLQYALTVEHHLDDDWVAAASYVGTRGRKLLRVATPGLGAGRVRVAFDSAAPLNASAPFPFLTGSESPAQANVISQSFAISRTFFDSDAGSSYNSLQFEIRKRFSSAFQFGSALTYSHSIDDASDIFDTAGSFALPQSSTDTSERASSSYDVRWRSVTHFVALTRRDLPFLKSYMGGWQFSGIVTAQTGQPYTVNSAFDVNLDGNLTDRLDTTAGLLAGGGGERSVLLRLAPGVATSGLLAPTGRDGSVGRNTFRAPGVFTFDLSVMKNFDFTSHRSLLFRADIFNFFNRPHFGVPERILESPGFGRAYRTTVPARTIQLGLKFLF